MTILETRSEVKVSDPKMGWDTSPSHDALIHQFWDSYLNLYKRYAPDMIILKTRSGLVLCNFGRGCYEQQFCENILNLGQWFRRRCRLKDFLSGALAAGVETFMQF